MTTRYGLSEVKSADIAVVSITSPLIALIPSSRPMAVARKVTVTRRAIDVGI